MKLASYETTVHLAKVIRKTPFKQRAPRAMKAIKAHVARMTGASVVHLDEGLNLCIWSRGIRNVVDRVRVQIDVEEIERKLTRAEELRSSMAVEKVDKLVAKNASEKVIKSHKIEYPTTQRKATVSFVAVPSFKGLETVCTSDESLKALRNKQTV